MVENYDRIDWMDDKSIEDFLISGGITFNVTYAGCIGILNSVKTLDSELRTATAAECMSRIHDLMSKKKIKRKKPDKRIRDFISDDIINDYSGTRVLLTVSYEYFEILIIKHHETLAKHEIQNVSFASIGESEHANYVAYVGRDNCEFRACYVLDCGPSKAIKVIKAIRTVFKVRSRKISNDDAHKIKTYKKMKSVQNISEVLPQSPPQTQSIDIHRLQMKNEIWYHGIKSREYAESLLKFDGDFLVRESTSMPGQFILSCYNNQYFHLILTDDKHKIKTNNKEFESINHFIEFHHKNNAPIIVPNNVKIFLMKAVVCDRLLL